MALVEGNWMSDLFLHSFNTLSHGLIGYIVPFLFVLTIVVFFHELGHFLAARRIGVRVITFSLGFGPKLFSMKRGDTEYAVSAIPLGGYVKMAGEQPDDERSGANDEFLSKTKWQRFQVLIAGPLMNVLLAIVVLAGVLYQGADVPLYQDAPPVVGRIAPDSPAAKAGIQVGDRIVSIDGVATPTWDDVFMYIVPKANREVGVMVDRGGQMVEARLTPDAVSKFELSGQLRRCPAIDLRPPRGKREIFDIGSHVPRRGEHETGIVTGRKRDFQIEPVRSCGGEIE